MVDLIEAFIQKEIESGRVSRGARTDTVVPAIARRDNQRSSKVLYQLTTTSSYLKSPGEARSRTRLLAYCATPWRKNCLEANISPVSCQHGFGVVLLAAQSGSIAFEKTLVLRSGL